MPESPGKPRGATRWIIGGIIAVLVLVVVLPFIYTQFIEGDPPDKLSVADITTPTTTATTGAADRTTVTTGAPGGQATGLQGTWTIADGSQAGYRVKETLFGQSATAVGRTSDVTGSMTIAGTKVTEASFTVDLTTVSSDQGGRDRQFQGRIMNTSEFPTATFKLTKPIELTPVPKRGTPVTKYSATGELTLHGTTKTVTIPLETQYTGDTIKVAGILTITFADYGIDNPSGGPATVGDSGQLEFALAFQK